MPISKERKEELVARYVSILENSDGFLVIRTQGLTVQRVQAIRKIIRGAGGDYVVGNNTLLIKALEQKGWVVPSELLAGPTAVAFGQGSFPSVVKAMVEYLKKETIDADKLTLRGGVLAGKEIFNDKGIENVASLPTLPEAQSQLIGLLVQPSIGLVTVINQATAGIVNVLQAWIDKQNEGSTEGAA